LGFVRYGNLAFHGQFVELEGDVVFTVEASVRTAKIAVYRTLHLDKPQYKIHSSTGFLINCYIISKLPYLNVCILK